MRPRSLLWLAAFLLFAERAFPQSPPSAAGRPGREVSMSPAEVKDTFFAYVLGIIRAGVEIDIDGAGMREILTEFKTALALPFDLITRVVQHTDASSGARAVSIDFQGPVSIPIPFSLLFYHPGSIVASPAVSFGVRAMGDDPRGYVLTLSTGTILVDIDDWLEVLLGAFIEDTWINNIVFFPWHGDWIGLLQGTGRRTGRQIRAYFDFTKNRIVFPVPTGLDPAARAFLP